MTDAHEAPENGAKSREVSLRAIEKRSVLLALLMVLASLPFRSLQVSAGVAVGGFLALLNYYWLKRFVETLVTRGGGKVSRLAVALYVFKYVLTGAAIFAAVATRMINIFGLLAGLLVVIISVTFEGLIRTSRIRKEGENAP